MGYKVSKWCDVLVNIDYDIGRLYGILNIQEERYKNQYFSIHDNNTAKYENGKQALMCSIMKRNIMITEGITRALFHKVDYLSKGTILPEIFTLVSALHMITQYYFLPKFPGITSMYKFEKMIHSFSNFNQMDSIKSNELLSEFDYRDPDQISNLEFVEYIQRPSCSSH